MEALINRLQKLLDETNKTVRQRYTKDQLTERPGPGKWSKKEILGHLIDSAINNLQRFTEIQFSPRPFAIRRYNQDELVRVNAYQQADTDELLNLWISLNKQIIRVIGQQNEDTLAYPLQLGDKPLFDLADTQGKAKSDLRFLITDYVDHMEHHLKRILNG